MKFLIGADLAPTKLSEPLFIAGDEEAIFGDILPIIKSADRFIVNLECALTEPEGRIRKLGPNLKASPRTADTLKKLGVTDVMLANNHSYDYGEVGLRDTAANLDRVGIPYTGVGENDTDSRRIYYFTEGGRRFAIVNVCEHEYSYALPNRYGTNPYDPYLTMHDIREAKKQADTVLVLYHGGKEFCHYPSPRLRLAAHEMVECGADVVIAQHSHCIGCYEEYEGGHILYGQGNLHFIEGDEHASWFESLLLELDIDGEGRITPAYYPIVSSCEDISVRLAEGERADRIMNEFKKRSEELLTGEWLAGWEEFCKNAPYYAEMPRYAFRPNSTENQNECFGHYIDCEAHADVMRELYKTWHREK